MTTPYVSYGPIGSDCYLRPPTYTNYAPTGSYCPPTSYYPPSTYCPPTFGSYPPYTNPQTYDLSREKDYYKSELYQHEEGTKGRDNGLLAGIGLGGVAGALGGAALWGALGLPGLVVGGILGAVGGGLLGSAFGQKNAQADAVLHDAGDDQQQELNGSPLEEQYHAPAYDPYYSAYPASGYYG